MGTGRRTGERERTLSDEEILIGGMAVIEGVMMRSPNFACTAIRKPSKRIAVNCERVRKLPFAPLYWPVVRGITIMVSMLVVGMKALTWSAQEVGEEDEKLSHLELALTVSVSLALAVGIFIGIPFLLAWLFRFEGFLFDLMDGVFRLAVFIVYLLLIGSFDDIKDLFAYHGAEHRTVHAYEAKQRLTPASVMRHANAHARCGTSFIMFVVAVSIVVFSLLVTETIWIKLVGRILLMPVVAGISYELLRWSAKPSNRIIMGILTWPGVVIQRLTTRDPRPDQVEVAIAALERCLAKERSLAAVRAGGKGREV
ncbi:DUF1385 domain-containing protein [Candidatus Woesearchaeota archaeon]|nr:DUF1385 domain-containing protein [Candidatus Woesearchaeota archaeon]